jgi:hypothetical protein
MNNQSFRRRKRSSFFFQKSSAPIPGLMLTPTQYWGLYAGVEDYELKEWITTRMSVRNPHSGFRVSSMRWLGHPFFLRSCQLVMRNLLFHPAKDLTKM